jgi:hypothetical protein
VKGEWSVGFASEFDDSSKTKANQIKTKVIVNRKR